MAAAHNGPVATRLILLSDLKKCAPASKVRFLGCVTGYSTKTAVLTLEHDYPTANAVKARVDITLLVTSMGSTETRIGEWVNVLGYRHPDSKAHDSTDEGFDVLIQAIILWPAGPFDLGGYENSLTRLKEERKED